MTAHRMPRWMFWSLVGAACYGIGRVVQAIGEVLEAGFGVVAGG